MSLTADPESISKKRYLGFLIWQSIPSTLIFVLTKTLSASLSPKPASIISLLASFIFFHFSNLLFSLSLSFLSSPHPTRPASLPALGLGLLRLAIGSTDLAPDFPRRARVSLSIAVFVLVCAFSGFVSVAAVCWGGWNGGLFLRRVLGFRVLGVGLLYGSVYVYMQRWVLKFPIIQRPLFFSFKMGLLPAFKNAIKFSSGAYLFSALLVAFSPEPFRIRASMGRFIAEQIIFYVGVSAVFLSWELTHHLHQVLHTKRAVFAPSRGSAAAETNPSEPLLAALEEASPNSLDHYLAFLDLCMVCENNVDTWRRAAFFEETGETYKRAIMVCLRPLEQLAMKLAECLETSDKTYKLSNQLLSPTDLQLDLYHYEQLNNYQLYAWCARSVSSLTERSHKEDRYGVAQLSGSNAAVMSTLVSCLLAVETFMGKKTHVQSPNQLMGPGGIKWAVLNTGRRDVPSSIIGKRRGSPLHSKAYAIADVIKASIYQIVSTFHGEMLAGAKSGLLERDWVINGKPPYGTRDLLLQKLRLFLDYRAS